MAKGIACRILEVRTGSGELLFSLRLIEKDEADPEPPKEEKKPNNQKGENEKNGTEKKNPASGVTDPAMTDAQKRYLVRILADQGFEKEAAHEQLKKAFGVDSLKNVTKLEASREIERRLGELKGGGLHG